MCAARQRFETSRLVSAARTSSVDGWVAAVTACYTGAEIVRPNVELRRLRGFPRRRLKRRVKPQYIQDHSHIGDDVLDKF